MPHEVDMTKALILSLREWWEGQEERRGVRRVVLAVGRFTCVEPALLTTAFARQKHGTFLENAELSIREVPFVAHCRICRDDYRPEIGLRYACPKCGGPMDEIRSGRELKIERIEWDARDVQT
jgi:hydrogenase nickel incorporation protein HypA/HybF